MVKTFLNVLLGGVAAFFLLSKFIKKPEETATVDDTSAVIKPPTAEENTMTLPTPSGSFINVPIKGTRIEGNIEALSSLRSLAGRPPSRTLNDCEKITDPSQRNDCGRSVNEENREYRRQLRALRSSVMKGARNADKSGTLSSNDAESFRIREEIISEAKRLLALGESQLQR